MSYYKMIKQVDEKISAAKATKKADLTGSGLLARTKFPVGPIRGTDVTDEIASYIDTIRTRKEELINGKD
jgi:hypothetical protein